MKYYPPPIIRFFIRYIAVLLLVVLPLHILIAAIQTVPPKDRLFVLGSLSCLFFGSCALFNFALLEKLFATIEISDNIICWKCPLRRSRSIFISSCIFSGVELEDSYNGLPYPFLFVSCHSYPPEYKNKINKLKCTDDFVKYWYSEALCKHLERCVPKGTAGALVAYRIRQKHH